MWQLTLQVYGYWHKTLLNYETPGRLGALQGNFFSKNPSYLWMWVGGSRSNTEKNIGKSSQNSHIPVLIFSSSIGPIPWHCALCLYTHYYQLLVIMIWALCPCQWWVSKKKGGGGWRWALLQFYFGFLEFYLTFEAAWPGPQHGGLRIVHTFNDHAIVSHGALISVIRWKL